MPVTRVVTDEGKLFMGKQFIRNTACIVCLFKNNYTPISTSRLEDFVISDFVAVPNIWGTTRKKVQLLISQGTNTGLFASPDNPSLDSQGRLIVKYIVDLDILGQPITSAPGEFVSFTYSGGPANDLYGYLIFSIRKKTLGPGTLASAITSSATSVPFSAVTPSTIVGKYFCQNVVTNSIWFGGNNEIMKCTAYDAATKTATVTRGIAGTTTLGIATGATMYIAEIGILQAARFSPAPIRFSATNHTLTINPAWKFTFT